MKCSIQGCPGQYEPDFVSHTVRVHGELVVVDHVPAEVCDLCGDTLLTPDTVRHLEQLLKERKPSGRTAPLYEYA